jgi:hypothetical protein
MRHLSLYDIDWISPVQERQTGPPLQHHDAVQWFWRYIQRIHGYAKSAAEPALPQHRRDFQQAVIHLSEGWPRRRVYREGLCLFAKPYRLTQKYPFSDKTHTSADFRVPADSKL